MVESAPPASEKPREMAMKLPYLICKLTLHFLEPCELPEFKGSTLRGGFGHALKRSICLYKNKICSECHLRQECAYAYIFESIPQKKIDLVSFGKYEAVPHPFIIEPPAETQKLYEKGANLSFNIILIGKATGYLPFFVMAFDRLGEIGIGKGKKKFMLESVVAGRKIIYKADNKELLPVCPDELIIAEEYDFSSTDDDELTFVFQTPVRLKYNRDNVTRLEFYILITNILRRIMLLNYFHGNGQLPSWDHKKIIQEAKKVTIKYNGLTWFDWERYSNRQKTRMKLGGLKGFISYCGPLKHFMPLVKAGEILHVGKGTSFGLGKYCINDLPEQCK